MDEDPRQPPDVDSVNNSETDRPLQSQADANWRTLIKLRDDLYPKLLQCLSSANPETISLAESTAKTFLSELADLYAQPAERLLDPQHKTTEKLLATFKTAFASLGDQPGGPSQTICCCTPTPALSLPFWVAEVSLDEELVPLKDPSEIPDEELEREIERVRRLIEIKRREADEWWERLAAGEGGDVISGPPAVLEILVRYLETLLVELNERKLLLIQLLSAQLGKRIREAVREGQRRGLIILGSAILVVITLPITIPLLKVLGCLSLASLIRTVQLFFQVGSRALQVLSSGRMTLTMWGAWMRQEGIGVLYETLLAWMARNIWLCILLQRVGFNVAQKLGGDPSSIGDLRELRRALKRLIEEGQVDAESVGPLLTLLNLLIEALGQ